jgi:hypothetical protein
MWYLTIFFFSYLKWSNYSNYVDVDSNRMMQI